MIATRPFNIGMPLTFSGLLIDSEGDLPQKLHKVCSRDGGVDSQLSDARGMELWPNAWGSPLSPSACHDVIEPVQGEQCNLQAGQFLRSTGSRFERAMHSNSGLLVLAADSRVVWPTLHHTFGDLLNATRWMPWDDPTSPPLVSMSYISARVPNVFCAQPTFDAMGCGAYDIILLFHNTAALWGSACACALNDACGRSLCSSYGKGARKLLRQVPMCPTRRETSEDWALAKQLCTSPGGLRENVGRCLITEETRSRPASWTNLERAMRLFQQACLQAPDGNTTFAIQPTCFGRNRGQLHNELQFRAQTTDRLGAQLEAALIGVGVVTVAATDANSAKSAQLANASATRLCRARRLARALQGRFSSNGRPLEVWRFELDPLQALATPQLYTAPVFRSKAHSCVGGGGDKRSDFAAEPERVWNKRKRMWARRRPEPPSLPHASFYGYYLEKGSWSQWARVY